MRAYKNKQVFYMYIYLFYIHKSLSIIKRLDLLLHMIFARDRNLSYSKYPHKVIYRYSKNH